MRASQTPGVCGGGEPLSFFKGKTLPSIRPLFLLNPIREIGVFETVVAVTVRFLTGGCGDGEVVVVTVVRFLTINCCVTLIKGVGVVWVELRRADVEFACGGVDGGTELGCREADDVSVILAGVRSPEDTGRGGAVDTVRFAEFTGGPFETTGT